MLRQLGHDCSDPDDDTRFKVARRPQTRPNRSPTADAGVSTSGRRRSAGDQHARPILREDILAELNQDDAQFILPLRTRLALLALLTASLMYRHSADAPPRREHAAAGWLRRLPQTPVTPKVPEPKQEIKASPPVATVKPAQKLPTELVKIEILAKVIREDKALDPVDAIKRAETVLRIGGSGGSTGCEARSWFRYTRSWMNDPDRSRARPPKMPKT